MAYIQIPSFTKINVLDNDTEFVIVVDGVENLVTFKTLSDKFGNSPELLAQIQAELIALRNIVNALPTENPAAPIALKISDTPIIDGLYKPTEVGTYPNAGGLVYDPTEGITYFIRTNGVWVKDVTPVNFIPDGNIFKGELKAVSGDVVFNKFENINKHDFQNTTPNEYIDRKNLKYELEGFTQPLRKIFVASPAIGNQVVKMTININRSNDLDFDLSDINRFFYKNSLNQEIDIPLTKGSYWSPIGGISAYDKWGRSTNIIDISNTTIVDLVIEMNPNAGYVNDFEYDLQWRLLSDELYDRTNRTKPLNVTIDVPRKELSSTTDIVNNEGVGKKEFFIDKELVFTNPKFHTLDGWKFKGSSMGHSTLKLFFNEAGLGSDVAGFFAESDFKMEDLTLVSINNNSGSNNMTHYATHIDKNVKVNASFKRVRFVSEILYPEITPTVNEVCTLLGIGTWDGQVLEFEDCILVSQTLNYGERNLVNSHNSTSSYEMVLGSRITFKNCNFIGGFGSLLIADVNTSSSTVKSVYELINCEIDSIKFNTFAYRNRYLFNVVNTKCGLLIDCDLIADTTQDTYDEQSLPMVEGMKFLRHLGTGTIFKNELVAYVYEDRASHWWVGMPVYKIPVGIEKLNSSNIDRFAGVSMLNVGDGNAVHVRTAGECEVNYYLPIGSNVYIQIDGTLSNLVTNNYIGKVVKNNESYLKSVINLC